MKKIISILWAVCLSACLPAFSQKQQAPRVPMTVALDEDSPALPAGSVDLLRSRMLSAITEGGMGATEDFCQFFMTCRYSVIDKHVIPGAPTKYFQTVEMTFFVVDAFSKKVFSSVSIQADGIGHTAAQADLSCVRSFTPSDRTVQKFVREANAKIIRYYDGQYRGILAKARALALGKKYEEALFCLSLIPESCKGYGKVLEAAGGIYSEYIDYKSNINLVKARSIWNAGQDAAAAAEAGWYLSEILPDAGCYGQAVALGNEIRTGVKDEIVYRRKSEELEKSRPHELLLTGIQAWKEVGVAFGNHQKPRYYHYESLF